MSHITKEFYVVITPRSHMATDNVFGHRGVRDADTFSLKMQFPFSCLVCGPSSCGKFFFLKMFLQKAVNVISKNIEKMVYIYDCWQPLYDDLMKTHTIKFIEGIPQTLNDDQLFPVNKTKSSYN